MARHRLPLVYPRRRDPHGHGPRWNVAAGQQRWIDPAAPLHGWRFSRAHWNPDRGVKVADINLDATTDDFCVFEPPVCRPRGLKAFGLNLMHPAVPGPSCTCGYNAVPRLEDLFSLRWQVEGNNHLTKGTMDGRVKPFWALLRVDVVGPIARGAASDDPPGTIRAAHLSLTRTVVLDAQAPDAAVEALASAGLLVRPVPDFWAAHTSCRSEAC